MTPSCSSGSKGQGERSEVSLQKLREVTGALKGGRKVTYLRSPAQASFKQRCYFLEILSVPPFPVSGFAPQRASQGRKTASTADRDAASPLTSRGRKRNC